MCIGKCLELWKKHIETMCRHSFTSTTHTLISRSSKLYSVCPYSTAPLHSRTQKCQVSKNNRRNNVLFARPSNQSDKLWNSMIGIYWMNIWRKRKYFVWSFVILPVTWMCVGLHIVFDCVQEINSSAALGPNRKCWRSNCMLAICYVSHTRHR